MIALPDAVPPRRFLSKALLIGLAFWLAGMILAHGPTLFSGFRRLQQNRADARLMHYFLEHEYRWISGNPHHRSFWEPPFFHPLKNAVGASETAAGIAPLYWIWRIVRVPQDIAYSLWLLSVSTLNFLAAWFFLRRILDRTPPAAGFGAFLFSFASMRLAHVGHPQLLAGFFLVLVVHALVRIFRESDRRGAIRWIAIGAAAFVGQVYASFTLAWFLGLALALGLVWSLALPSLRTAAIAGLRTHGAGLAAGAAAAGLCLIPFISHIESQGIHDVPRLQSWFTFGADHWIFGRFSALGLVESEPIAPGLVTMVLAGLGLWRLRETPIGRLLLAVTVTLIVCTLMLPGGASLWSLLSWAVPGAHAVRAVGRVSMILLLPIAAGAASMIDRSGWKKPALIGVSLLAMLEQGRTTPTLDRFELRHATAALVKQIDPNAEAFFLSDSGPSPSPALLDRLPIRVHLDAMMASLESGVPTINGYSGGTPPGWRFENLALAPDPAQVEKELEEWCRDRGMDRRRVQWVQKGR